MMIVMGDTFTIDVLLGIIDDSGSVTDDSSGVIDDHNRHSKLGCLLQLSFWWTLGGIYDRNIFILEAIER
jgi:hypothetical protein